MSSSYDEITSESISSSESETTAILCPQVTLPEVDCSEFFDKQALFDYLKQNGFQLTKEGFEQLCRALFFAGIGEQFLLALDPNLAEKDNCSAVHHHMSRDWPIMSFNAFLSARATLIPAVYFAAKYVLRCMNASTPNKAFLSLTESQFTRSLSSFVFNYGLLMTLSKGNLPLSITLSAGSSLVPLAMLAYKCVNRNYVPSTNTHRASLLPRGFDNFQHGFSSMYSLVGLGFNTLWDTDHDNSSPAEPYVKWTLAAVFALASVGSMCHKSLDNFNRAKDTFIALLYFSFLPIVSEILCPEPGWSVTEMYVLFAVAGTLTTVMAGLFASMSGDDAYENVTQFTDSSRINDASVNHQEERSCFSGLASHFTPFARKNSSSDDNTPVEESTILFNPSDQETPNYGLNLSG